MIPYAKTILPTWSASPQPMCTGSDPGPPPCEIMEPDIPCATMSNEPRSLHGPFGPNPLLVA